MRGIRKAFGATVALDGVDLSVAAGEICGLVGENGAGKSTLMAILAGALQPDAGTMAIDGQPYAPRSPIEARRAGVAMIYQELSLAPHLTVMENILLGAEPTRFGLLQRGRMREIATRALARARPRRHLRPTRSSATLSVAVQQLVEIARAIAVGLPRAGARRADEQPRPRGRAASVRAAAPPARRRATRSSTSRTSSKK